MAIWRRKSLPLAAERGERKWRVSECRHGTPPAAHCTITSSRRAAFGAPRKPPSVRHPFAIAPAKVRAEATPHPAVRRHQHHSPSAVYALPSAVRKMRSGASLTALAAGAARTEGPLDPVAAEASQAGG